VKKAILIISALVMVVSGVAAVSAYEAHVVNVKAKVENALAVTLTTEDEAAGGLHFGTVFPQEWLNKHFFVGFSTSWSEQTRKNTVQYQVWAESKETDTAGVYYPWLGEGIYVKINGNWGYCGPAPAGTPPVATQVKDYSVSPAVALVGTLTTGDSPLQVYVYLDVPPFFDDYNELTDVPNKPRDVNGDTQLAGYLNSLDTGSRTPADVQGDPSFTLPSGTPQGYEMGVDLKIQVSDIKYVGT
jgi:hypothetical protein